MANIGRKISLTSTAGGSGPNYKVEWSIDGVNYSESIDCGNISLPSVGSFVNCSIDENSAFLRLTSLNIFCSNSVSESVILPITPNKIFKIESNNNTGFDFNISGSNKLQLNVGFPSILEKNFIPTGSTELSAARIISGSKGLSAQAFFTGSYGLMEFTQSMTGNPGNQNLGVFFTVVDTRTEPAHLISYGNRNYDLFSQLTGSFTFNSASDDKNVIIESQNNTTWYAGTASSDDIFVNRFRTYNLKQDTYPSGFLTTSATRKISGSDNVATDVNWPIGYGRLSVTQSIFLDNALYSSTNGIFDTALTTGVSLTPGAINYNNVKIIKSVTTINDAPITGSKQLILNVQNNTTEAIDYANINFNFQDAPNFRPLNTTTGFGTSGIFYYISGSSIPVGNSSFTTKMNITASFTSSVLIFDIDPDQNSTTQRYTISSSFFTDGTPRTGGGVSSPTSRVNSSVSADFNFNPTTWATLSLDITCSYTESVAPTSSVCYEIVGVQSAPGECFDCPGFFASSTDIQITFFDECSGSIIPAPFDINVEARYANNTTESTFIPSGSTGSINIAFEDVQCAPLPACGEIASPQFVSASVVPVTGSISECCI